MLDRVRAFCLARCRVNPRAFEFLQYVGPGLLVTVGFIDPGNWASNIAAGSDHGYALLWMVTLSTIMLILLQHNAAHLGIATGLCLSEAATLHLRPAVARTVLGTAVLAAVSTMLAEILGAAIALKMLAGVPLRAGAALAAAIVATFLFTNSYRRLERCIIGFVSLIGLGFLFELALVRVDWSAAAAGWVAPTFPPGAMPVIMSVLGAVVMPHNLFLHSEIIQSRRWNLADEAVIRRQLDYELLDTLFSMGVGWAINSAMILVAAATFHAASVDVTDLEQAEALLRPLLGPAAATVFALALLFSGISSSVTAGIAGGSIFAGMFGEPYDIDDRHSRAGVWLTLGGALAAVLLVGDPFRALLVSQMLLSVQLPLTIFAQVRLTASPRVMGRFVNTRAETATLLAVGAIVTFLNLLLLASILRGA